MSNRNDAAASAVGCAREVIATAARHLAVSGDVEDHQLVAYDLGHAAAAIEIAAAVLEYRSHGDTERRLAEVFVAEAVHDLAGRLLGREVEWGVEPGALDPAMPFVRAHRSTASLTSLADQEGSRHLDPDFEMVRDTYRRFADDHVRPIAEHVHRRNGDIPEEVIVGLAELGTFGLSIPEEYGGSAIGGEGELLAMVVATEELSRAVARRRRVARDSTGDPHPGVAARCHRDAEAVMAPASRQRRADGRRRGHRARHRLRQRRGHHQRHPDR